MPNADDFFRRSIAELLAARQAHERGDADGAATMSRMVASIRPVLTEATSLGLTGADARSIALTLAQLADFWCERFRHPNDSGDPSDGRRHRPQAYWARHRVAGQLFGDGDDSPHFSQQIVETRLRVHAATVNAWAAALALGCRGPLRPAESSRLCAQLLPQPPSQVLPDALMNADTLPARRSRGGRWLLPSWLGCAALAAILLWMAARAELAGLVGPA